MPSSPWADTLPTATCPDHWVTVQSEITTLVKPQPKLLSYLRSRGPPKRKYAQLADWKRIGAQYRDLIPLTSPCPINNHKKSSCWLKAAVMLLFPLASLYQNSCRKLQGLGHSCSTPARIKTCEVMLQIFSLLGAPRFLSHASPAASKLLVQLLGIIQSPPAWTWYQHRTAKAIRIFDTPQKELRFSYLPYHFCCIHLYPLPSFAIL